MSDRNLRVLLEKAREVLAQRQETIQRLNDATKQATADYYVQLGAVAMLKELVKEESEDGNSTITGEKSESNVIPFSSPETSGRGTDKPYGLDPTEGV